jgi:hypothetical protein
MILCKNIILNCKTSVGRDTTAWKKREIQIYIFQVVASVPTKVL